jgi:hypothetical protein
MTIGKSTQSLIAISSAIVILAACVVLEASITVEDAPRSEEAMEKPEPLLESYTPAPDGLIYLLEDEYFLLSEDGVNRIGTRPITAGRRALGPRFIAYMDRSSIKVIPLSGEEPRNLITLGEMPGMDVDLKWARDGADLSYSVSWDEPDGSRLAEIYVHDGYRQDRIVGLTLRSPDQDIHSTPDPSSILGRKYMQVSILSYDRRQGKIALLAAGGEERYGFIQVYNTRNRSLVSHHILENDHFKPSESLAIHDLVISPDFTKLAFVNDGLAGNESGLVVFDLINEVPFLTHVLPVGVHATWLSWSPDGRHLAFLINEGSGLALDVSASIGLEFLDLESGQISPLPWDVSVESSILGWTQDSKAICVVSHAVIDLSQKVTLFRPQTGDAYFLPVPDNAMVLGWVGNFTGQFSPVFPQVTPALTTTVTATPKVSLGRLAFVSNMDGELAIYTITTDGTMLTRLTSEPMLIMHPTWSPNGTKLIFEVCRGGDLGTNCPEEESFDIYVVEPDG